MRTQEILNLMEYWSHCHECGALLVTVPGGSICPHCGFELEDPEEKAVVELRRVTGSAEEKPGFWTSDDLPDEEAA